MPTPVIYTLVALAGAVVLLPTLVRPNVAAEARGLVDRWMLGSLAATLLVSLSALVASQPGAPTILRIGQLDLFGVRDALGLVFWVDRVTLAMLATVSVVAFTVVRFSLRYLDGEAALGRFLGWLGFTIGAVESLVLAGHLVQLSISWVLVSTGLHFLLVHYADRPAAIRTARRKFLVSRLGDVGLVFAIAVLAHGFGTLDLEALFRAAEDPSLPSRATSLSLAGFGFALAAICKSAQVPMHGWLPDTLEAPTPVSALMHAGIVNAGGYLLIRTSPLLASADGALASLLVSGALTAALGTLVMNTQTEAKKALAWSTVAQMGFMIVQCGLGAMVPALLHIVGHSLYKAHAFLASGVLPRSRQLPLPTPSPALALPRIALGAALGFGVLVSGFTVLGHVPSNLPGGYTLMALGALGLAGFLAPGASTAGLGLRVAGLVTTGALAVGLAHLGHAYFAADVAHLLPLEQRGVAGKALAVFAVLVAVGTAATSATLAWATARGEGLGLYLALRTGSPLAYARADRGADLQTSDHRLGSSTPGSQA